MPWDILYSWLLHKNDNASFYISANKYKVNKKQDRIDLIARSNGTYPSFSYFIKKGDKEIANIFYITGMLGGLKNSAKIHFEDRPEMVDRFKKGDLKKKSVEEVIAAYIESTN